MTGRAILGRVSVPAPLRLAVVGCGAVAELYHLPAIAATESVELVALVDPALHRARTLAGRHGASHALPDASELPGLVDAAVVATPNRLHAAVASSLLRAGIHTLVEKPLARTTLECDEIAAAAASSGALAAVGHDFRWFPVAGFAKELFESRMLGRVEHVDLRQSQTGGWPSRTASSFSRDDSGGGVLLDFGVHMLDLLGWWLGGLHPSAYRDDAAGGVEAECEVDLDTGGGARVHVALSRRRTMRETFVVRCERATVEIGIFEPALLRISLPAGGAVEGDVPDDEFARAPILTVFRRQLEAFASAIRTGSGPVVSLADGRRAVALVETCYSMREPLRRPWDWPDALAAARTVA